MMRIKALLTISTIALFSFSSVKAQLSEEKITQTWVGRTIYHFFNDTSSPGTSSLRFYPSFGFSPETSLEVGVASNLLFQAKQDTANRLSELQAYAFATLKGQYGLWLDNAIYGDKDTWFFLGRTRFQNFPLLYYGVGPESTGDHPAVIDASYLMLKQRVMHKTIPNLFTGPEVDYQLLFNAHFQQPEQFEYTLPHGSDGTSNLGLGWALVYDDRHNVMNVRKGKFAELSFLNYSDKLGSEYSFMSIITDFRSYHKINARDVFAWQLYGNFLTGTIPFNQLALMGGDMMMRGYYMGRYRDNNLYAAQAEYRMLPFKFSKRWGGTLFSSVAAVSPSFGNLHLEHFRLAGGAGIRYLLFPKKDIYMRFDVGATKEGVNFYFFTGEAF